MRAVYGFKSAEAVLRSHLASFMKSMVNGHVMRPEVCPEDKVQYYAYMLCCVYDILFIHHDADSVIEHLHWSFP